MYLRFVLLSKNPDTGVADGIFETAYGLRRDGELCAADRRELQDLLDWFGTHLRVPGRFNRTKSKGYSRRATKGVSWVKPSADLHITKLHRLAGILRRHGHQVTLVKAKRPGYVVYEDDHQVVAEPFNDVRS